MSRDPKCEFESFKVNEPSVFESMKFYCILLLILVIATVSLNLVHVRFPSLLRYLERAVSLDCGHSW